MRHEVIKLNGSVAEFWSALQACSWTSKDRELSEAEWDSVSHVKNFSAEVKGAVFKLWRGYPAKGMTATMYLHGVVREGSDDTCTLVIRARPNRTLRLFPLLAMAMPAVMLFEVQPRMSLDQPIAIVILLMVPLLVFGLIWLPMRYAFRWEGRKLLREFKERVIFGRMLAP
ncbi:MAG: hypothetical protein WEC15_07555 [Flavobacteriales bacterium]